MTMTRALVAIGVTLSLGVGAAPAAKEERHPAPTSMDRPAPMPTKLTSMTRSLLASRMRWHMIDLQELIGSIVALDFATAITVAKTIEEDSRVARPSKGSEGLAGGDLPEAFFTLQDRVRQLCSQLRPALRRRDVAAVSKYVGELTTTCVQCHAALAPDLNQRR